jgi:hypothetical protein
MADTDASPPLAEARLGVAPPNSILRFTIPRNGGYVTEAVLLQGTKVAASWESIEILGKTTDVVLTPTANYTLMIDVTFTRAEKSEVILEFSSHKSKDAPPLRKATTGFSGKKPQIGRSFTFIRIARP